MARADGPWRALDARQEQAAFLPELALGSENQAFRSRIHNNLNPAMHPNKIDQYWRKRHRSSRRLAWLPPISWDRRLVRPNAREKPTPEPLAQWLYLWNLSELPSLASQVRVRGSAYFSLHACRQCAWGSESRQPEYGRAIDLHCRRDSLSGNLRPPLRQPPLGSACVISCTQQVIPAVWTRHLPATSSREWLAPVLAAETKGRKWRIPGGLTRLCGRKAY